MHARCVGHVARAGMLLRSILWVTRHLASLHDFLIVGMQTCGLVLDNPNLDLLWSSLDDDGGGDLDYQELCQKLEGQYKKVLEAEQKHLRFMPRLLASKLEPLMPPNTTRARLGIVLRMS